jgi:glycosyltransferase involved in cell wall biosynthesis
MYPFFKRMFLRFLTKRNISHADKIIVPSQSTKNDLVEYYKTDPNKIFIIHHGV